MKKKKNKIKINEKIKFSNINIYMSYKRGVNLFKKKPKKTKKQYCSPKNHNNKYSCFNKKSLLKIIKEWNKLNKDKIKYSEKNSVPKLWSKINIKMNKKCYGEWCWAQEEFIKNMKDDEIKNTFRPKTPKSWYKDNREWLSTIDIEKVLNQYEDLYPDFQFIGAVPLDFDYKLSIGRCVIDELCNINIDDNLNKRKNRIGIVFNLDKHNESGSHWICMFIDLYKDNIYYFDSYGDKPPKEVKVLSNRIIKQGKDIGRKINYMENKLRHQYKTSECGTYCINFIVSLLEGKSFESLTEKRLKDDIVNRKRDLFYAPSL